MTAKGKRPWYEKSDAELFAHPMVQLLIFLAALLVCLIWAWPS